MKITINRGPDHGTSAEIAGDVFTIGRDPANDLVLTDPQVSSKHAAIDTAADGSVAVRDLNSTNGTFVNGRRVEGSVALTGSELMQFGDTYAQLSEPIVARTIVRPVEETTKIRPTVPPSPVAEPAPVAEPGPEQPARGGRRLGASVGIAAVVVLAAGGVAAAIALSGGGSSRLTLEQLISRATPSVVRIEGARGAGSGIVIDAKHELVLTNAHVVVGNTELKAQLGNGTTTVPLRLVAASPCDDLAVVKMTATVPRLKALPLGSSASIHPGDQVTVLGFPGSFQEMMGSQMTGLQQASTVVANTGIVSQVNVQGAPDPSLPTYRDLIVHQAPVNHGNSGGPLLDRGGRVVGINTLSNPETQGQYYAIAIDYAKKLLPALEAGRSHGLIGWNLQAVSADDPNLQAGLASLYEHTPAFASIASTLAARTVSFLQQNHINGMYDANDIPGTAAAATGTAGFLIDKINGTPVTTLQAVCNIVNGAAPGQALQIHNYNLASGTDISQLSVALALDGKDPAYAAKLKVPSQ